MKPPSLRTVAEIIGAVLFCAAGFAAMYYIDCYREAGHIQTIKASHEQSLLYLAAPLFECRAGKDWTKFKFDDWKEANPDCDVDCITRELRIQLRNRLAKESDSLVAER